MREQDENLENILGAILFALRRGANGTSIDLVAIRSFRQQFVSKIETALQEPDWKDHWRHENVYVLAQAAAVGQRAAFFAGEEGRRLIIKQDLDAAMTKVRGHLPIAGRWCPF